VVAGGNAADKRTDALNLVTGVVVDKHGTMFVCDRENRKF
jgi:hypothetical protein